MAATPVRKQIRSAIPPLSVISFDRCFLSARIVLILLIFNMILIVNNRRMIKIILRRMVNK